MSVSRKNILLYEGEGSSEQSVRMALHTFKYLLENTTFSVQKICPELILEGSWQNTTALLIIGGGYDLGYINALGSDGMAMIRNYVEGGGSYLGICAGGYFGCRFIEFDKGGPLEVCGKRQLNFYPGGCIGPAYPGFAYSTERGAYAVPISWDISNICDYKETSSSLLDAHCYFNGGGYFTPASSSRITILGRYSEKKDNSIAIVKNQVGKGTVVLSGVHFEYDPSLLDKDDLYLKERNIVPTLNASLSKTLTGIRSILKHLHVLCN